MRRVRRNYYSPSAVSLIERCQRAAAYRYIAGLRLPDVEWADIEAGRIRVLPRGERVRPGQKGVCSSRQKAPALGKAVHRVYEDYFQGLDPDWFHFPGLVAASGVHLFPRPDECLVIEVERSVGTVPSGETKPGKPTHVIELDGVRWAGMRDLLVHSPDGCARLGIDAPGGWLLGDYKSTKSIKLYAKTKADLCADTQRALYGLDVCRRSGQDTSLGRWAYLETDDTRRAAPVDTVLSEAQAIEVLRAKHDLIWAFDRIERVEDAECNPAACDDYGGCEFHVSAGGPCNARRSLGSLIKRSKANTEVTIMGLSPEAQKKIDEARAKRAAATGTTTTTTTKATAATEPPPAQVDEVVDADTEETGADPEPTKAAPPARPAPRGRPGAAKVVPSGRVGAILALQTELTDAEAAVQAAEAKRDAVIAAIAKACG